MPLLYNSQTQAPEVVPQEQLGAATTSGQYLVPVNDAEGNPQYVPPTEVQHLVKNGNYSLPSNGQLQDILAQHQYGSGVLNPLAAFGSGIVDTATLGIAPEILSHFSPGGIEMTKQLQQYNPTATALGKLAGIVTPLAAPESAIAAPFRAVNAIGEGAEAGVKALGASPFISALSKGAAEGGLYGASNVLSEHALGDPDLTAEHIAGQIGLSALAGGALSGLFSKFEAPKALEAAKESLLSDSEQASASSMGSTPTLTDKLLAKASGKTPEAIADIRVNRNIDLDSAASDLGDQLQKQHDLVEQASKQAAKVARPQEIGQLLEADRISPDAALVELNKVESNLNNVVQQMRSEPNIHSPFLTEKLAGTTKALGEDIQPNMTASEIYNRINQAKQEIDSYAKWSGAPTPEMKESLGAVRGARNLIKDSLENGDVWGKTAARQAEYNDALSEHFQAQKDLRKAFFTKDIEKGQPVYSIDKGKVLNYLKATSAKAESRGEALTNYQTASKNLLNQIETTYKNTPTSFDPKAYRDTMVGLSDAHDFATERAQQLAAAKLAKKGSSSPLGGLFGLRLAGAALGIPAGPVEAAYGAYKGFKYLRNPELLYQRLSELEKVARVGAKDMAAKATRVFSGATSSAPEASGSLDKAFAKAKAVVEKASNDPETTMEAMGKAAEAISDHAPQTAQALHATFARGMAFLSAQIPRSPQNGPLGGSVPPSQSQMADFVRTYNLIDDPSTLFSKAASGSITPKDVQAVAAVYPKLYQQMQKNMLESLTKVKAQGKSLSSAQKLSIQMILGTSPTGGYSPQSILRNQLTINSPPPAPIAPNNGLKAPRSRGSSAVHIKVAGRYETPLQSALNRSGEES